MGNWSSSQSHCQLFLLFAHTKKYKLEWLIVVNSGGFAIDGALLAVSHSQLRPCHNVSRHACLVPPNVNES